ncbi:MAG TPA: AMP-binding protein [Chloroflexota bacterium]|nr:AMP-binding protein [Chloroflexota bacterium]HZU07350.1 AMP-binding protein [Chloroflexota bacterium]
MEVTYYNPALETADRATLEAHQLTRLRSLLATLLARNPFYGPRLRAAGLRDAAEVRTLADLRHLPFTRKAELIADQEAHPPYGTNLTYPLTAYTRLHQTSGTTGRPLRILDTPSSWDWWLRCWGYVYRGAGVGPEDRIFCAFSFGPFIGFWSAFEAGQQLGALVLAGGGQSSEQRLQMIADNQATVLVCTPTYALRLAEVAREQGFDTRHSTIRATIHAGEPGANIPATKRRIEEAWGARCFDHAGATEVGAHSFECVAQPGGIHMNEAEFIFEVLDPQTDQPADEGELVITNLGREGMPVLRYRTGDRVKLQPGECPCGRTFRRLEGGILGRVDDMLTVRGVNVFPSAIENLVRRFTAVDEFVIEVYRERAMDELELQLEVVGEPPETVCEAVAREIWTALGFRPRVRAVPAGSLPRFELKARRVRDRRVLTA